ncbi:H(+)/Cl(-) exchange transporter 4, partial [Araneus ventricosus]
MPLSPNSTDLPPLNFFLFSKLKVALKEQRFRERHYAHSSYCDTGIESCTVEAFSRAVDGGGSSQDSSQELDELPHCIGQYGDFHTIDWQRDLSRDTYRQKYIARKAKESFRELLKGYYDKLSGWLCVFCVGVAAGSVAGFIDIGEGWMKDLKEGICPEAFWLNKEQCCWSSNETFYEGDECDQ